MRLGSGCDVGLTLLILIGATILVQGHQGNRKIVELSQTVREEIPYYPNVETYHLNVTHNGTTKDGYWYQIDAMSGSTHTATHIDSPCHFHKGGWCVADIPLENLLAPGAVVDIRHKVGDNADYVLTVSDLQDWEKEHGPIPDGSVLLIATGWDRYWNDPDKYLGSMEKDPSKLHFPGVAHETAQWLADNRKIVGIGLDTISLDAGQARSPKAHTILSARNVYNLENLANIGDLPPTGAMIYSFPVKLSGASGAPARVVGIIENGHNAAVTSSTASLALLFVCALLVCSCAR